MIVGVDKFQQQFESLLDELRGPRTERTITEILISVQSHTMPMVPIDTSTLANSIYRVVTPTANGYEGTFGFTAKYARAVHDKPGTLKGTGTPRDPKRPGRGNFWDPAGEPKFLEKGIQEAKSDELREILIRGYSIGQ